MEGRGEMALKVLARKARVLLLECCGHFLAPKMFVSTLFSLIKNLVYKNIEAQIWKKIRTIIRTLSASQ